MKKTEESSSAPLKQVEPQANDPYYDRILESARELFQEAGLENVSMYSIAKRAGIGQGSLYRRFTDKGEICSALLRHSTGRFLTALEQETQTPQEEDSRSALERLQRSIEQVVDFIDEHAELLHMIKSEFVGKKQLTQFEHPFYQRVSVILTDLLAAAVQNGETVEVDHHFTVTALLSVLSPDLYLYQQKVHGSTKTEIIQGITTLFIKGLAKSKD